MTEIKKQTIISLVQYLCDINEFGFEDENIDSMPVWGDKAQEVLYKLKESDGEVVLK
jgi:hypothetical protein